MENSRTICILELGCKRLRAVIFWRICFFFSLRRCGTSNSATRAAKPTCFEKARGVSARVIRERFSTESVTQWSGQTSGIRERINFGRPGEISKKNLRNNCCPANKQKKIEMFIEICKRMKKEGKENPRIFEPEVNSSSYILLLHQKSYTLLTLYTLTSVWIFSILFSIHFQRGWHGEFVQQSRVA